ncbi:hypothetical protein NEAUS06_1667 [Nematocida ausubeli]|nr:hypothetical protein NEAUS06_1667 [Nematocida ausubeli]
MRNGVCDEMPSQQMNKNSLLPTKISMGALKRIHKEWADSLIKELQIFTLQENYAEFMQKEKQIEANPAWHISTPWEKLAYFQRAIICRRDNSYAPIIPRITTLLQSLQTEKDAKWIEDVLPKLIDILDQYNLSKIWHIPFCFDFHDMRTWAITLSYDVLKDRVPWHAVVKLLRRKGIHDKYAQLDEGTPDTDLLISISTEIDMERIEKEGCKTNSNSLKYISFCTFCNKKGHIPEVCNSVQKHKRQKSTMFTVANSNGLNSDCTRIFIELSLAGHSVKGRHSTGSDINIVGWHVYNKLATKTGSLKIKNHTYTLIDIMNRPISCTAYMECTVQYKKKSLGTHRFFIVDGLNEDKVDQNIKQEICKNKVAESSVQDGNEFISTDIREGILGMHIIKEDMAEVSPGEIESVFGLSLVQACERVDGEK